MNPFLERSVFLRTLNFLRVKHDFASRYTYWYPAIVALCTVGLLYFMAPKTNVYGSFGLLNQLSAFLAVFAPFFLASLAAVATFAGPDFLDESFQMSSDVELDIVGELGALQPMDVTPRHFLSLLFGYCCVIALGLFLLTILVPAIAPGVSDLFGTWATILGWLFLFLFLFLFFQIILLTLLGIYYLSDKIHRPH